jgi:hypothetical protein
MSGAAPILGVDPGITGGIAFLYPSGKIKADDVPLAKDHGRAVKACRDYHGVPTLFIDEDDCELGRFPSETEGLSKAVALEEESRFLQELATATSDEEIADIFARYKDFRKSLPPHQRERLLAEAQDIIAGNNHGG